MVCRASSIKSGFADCCGVGCPQVEELDLNKTKATELLKAHEGDAIKAMRAFVTAAA